LPGNCVFNIYEDSQKRIWISTDKGIACFDNEAWKTFPETAGKIESGVRYSFLEDAKGNLWIYSTESSTGIVFYDNNAFILYNKSTGLSDNTVNSLFFDPIGRLWVLPENPKNGLSMFDGNRWNKYDVKIGTAVYDYPSVLFNGNALWFYSLTEGITLFDGEKMMKFDTSNGFPDNQIVGVCIDKDHKVWVAVKNAVAVYDNSKWVIYNTQNSKIPSEKITRIFQDVDELICISTGKTHAKFVNGQWEPYQLKKINKEDEILYFKEDGAGNLWYVTRNEFVLMKGGEEIHYAAIDEFQRDAYWFHLFPDGRIMLRLTLSYTADEVFYVFDKKEWTLQKMPKIADWKKGFIEQYTIDSHEVLWFASLYNGLKSFDGANWKLYKKSEGFFSDDIYSVIYDSKNRLWVGSKDNGLVIME